MRKHALTFIGWKLLPVSSTSMNAVAVELKDRLRGCLFYSLENYWIYMLFYGIGQNKNYGEN